jgi:hypothetical protein
MHVPPLSGAAGMRLNDQVDAAGVAAGALN